LKTTRTSTTRLWLTAIAALIAAGSAAAQTLPTSPNVVNGQATFNRAGNVYSITNTPGAIIQWQGFSIGAGDVTRFLQQSASSTVLNRIVGQDPSLILGTLQSNGRVFLVNPNGVLFGAGSRVDVNGLVASSLALSNQDFLAGKMNFSAGATAGSVANEGRIATPGGGSVYLIAPSVGNSGVIQSPGGEVVLAAGRSVQLVDSLDPDLHVVVSAPADHAVNLGQILAQGGRVGIYGGLVNQRGLVSADSAVAGADGKIVFKASGDLLLEAGSVTSATGAGTGGTVHLLGDRVGLTGDARVDASGQAGGGTVLAGGDAHGANPAIPNAKQVYVSKDAVIRADAVESGNGGKVVAWSDGSTRMYGSISARGGRQSGDGGWVETSGRTLDMQGRVDTRAPHGRTGSLLLDPTDIYIANDQTSATSAGMTSTDTATGASPNFAATSAVADSLLTVATLQTALSTTQVTVSTANAAGTGAGVIRVVDPVTWAIDTSLSLDAAAGIEINGAITGGAGSTLALRTAAGDITQAAPISVTSLVAHADTGSVVLTNASNQVGILAGFANGTSGFNYTGSASSTPLTIGGVTSTLVADVGIASLGAGPNNITAGGDLIVAAPVMSMAGDVVVAAATPPMIMAPVGSTSGRVTIQGVVVQPSLADCTADPTIAGCTAVLPTLAACTADPTLPGCSVVLPTLAACTADPTLPGCSVVLPTLAACTADPTLAGCTAVLPTLAACTATPSLPGCTAVLPTLAACTATPSLAGCTAVLPTLAACTTTPSLAGCSAVLPSVPPPPPPPPPPTLSACIADPTISGCGSVLPSLASCTVTPTLAGCSVVLPSLSTCTITPTLAGCSAVLPSLAVCSATPTAAGCSAVLPTIASCTATPTLAGCAVVLPTLATCTANPTLAGCSAVLPSMSICIASPGVAGCSVVLPSIAACTATPSAAGCSAVLPSLSSCVAAPSIAGCSAVLPSVASCVANPAQAGCSAVLPTLAQCSASPTLAGCSVVLPTLAQCTSTPTLAGCSVVLPPVSACVANPAAVGCQVVLPPTQGNPPNQPLAVALNTTVNIVNTSSPPSQGTPPADKKDGKKDDKTGTTVAKDNGAKKDAPPPKTFCN
jgi:filamentous hemagglutinin family protein